MPEDDPRTFTITLSEAEASLVDLVAAKAEVEPREVVQRLVSHSVPFRLALAYRTALVKPDMPDEVRAWLETNSNAQQEKAVGTLLQMLRLSEYVHSRELN